jgi:hypothetical protein
MTQRNLVQDHTSHCLDHSQKTICLVKVFNKTRKKGRWSVWGHYSSLAIANEIAAGLAYGHPDWYIAIELVYLDQGF